MAGHFRTGSIALATRAQDLDRPAGRPIASASRRVVGLLDWVAHLLDDADSVTLSTGTAGTTAFPDGRAIGPAASRSTGHSQVSSFTLLMRYAPGMLPRSYDTQRCSIARTLEIVGDRWTMLVVREAFSGTRRFEHFQRNLGIARTVLAQRLGRLVDDGLLRKERYQDHPERFEYRLTGKGLDLWPVLMALLTWGDRYAIEGPPSVVVLHQGCGGGVDDRRMCTRCGNALGPFDVLARFDDPRRGHTAGDGQERPVAHQQLASR